MPIEPQLLTSGEVAALVGIARWRLLYLIEKGTLASPSFSVPGRRLFTSEDVQRISKQVSERPDLRDAIRGIGESS